ncbi:MAG: glycoside hydrolase family 5 protein, partial [Kiritimatiellia bacterium]
LPFLWERIQPIPGEAFAEAYSAKLVETIRALSERGIWVIPDVHNYGRYTENGTRHLIGRGRISYDHFGDLWFRLADLLKNEPNIWAYGLMNEPHLAGGEGIDWRICAQTAIDAIRKTDLKTEILVANDYPGWAAPYQKGDLADWAAKSMPIGNPGMLNDPSNRLRFELHSYFDFNNSGLYQGTYVSENARENGRRVNAMTGVQRVRPFVEWLERYQVKGLLGEFSIPANPSDDSRWLDALENLLVYLQEKRLPATYWGAGDRWNPGIGYVISPRGWTKALPEEVRRQPRPQAVLLRKYMDGSPVRQEELEWLAKYREMYAGRPKVSRDDTFVELEDFSAFGIRRSPIYHISKNWNGTWAGNCAFWPMRDGMVSVLRTPYNAWGHECYYRNGKKLRVPADADSATLYFRVKTADEDNRLVSIGLAPTLKLKSANVPEEAMGAAVQIRDHCLYALERADTGVSGKWMKVASFEPGTWVGVWLVLHPKTNRYDLHLDFGASAKTAPAASGSFVMPPSACEDLPLLITTRGKGSVDLADLYFDSTCANLVQPL